MSNRDKHLILKYYIMKGCDKSMSLSFYSTLIYTGFYTFDDFYVVYIKNLKL